MQHHIPVASLGPDGAAMARAVEACVHCGFCLPACPTYRVLGEEMDSPRGRIVLMKQALEGELALSDVLPFVDKCLGCLACVTACPSGVRYGELVTPFRARAEEHARGATHRVRRAALLTLLESRSLFRLAIGAGRLARRVRFVLPASLRTMLDLLPAGVASPRPLPALTPAAGRRRARVALLAGCVQHVLSPGINEAAIRVLSRSGMEVIVPPGLGCCGALALHTGRAGRARRRAERLMAGFPTDVDAVVTTAAGCGSAMKEYGALFAATPCETTATAFAGRVRDVSEVLEELGIAGPLALRSPLTVAYHDACHLSHAQHVRSAPRRLLAQVGNLTVRELSDPEICCGSAGLYNLEQPDVARTLGAQKAQAVIASGADAVVTGNVGCMVQIAAHCAGEGRAIPALHTVELLDRAMRDGHPGVAPLGRPPSEGE